MTPTLGLITLKRFLINDKTLIFSVLVLGIFVSLGIQGSYAIDDYNFAAVGDWACTSNTDATVNNIVQKNPEVVLGLGDYSYSSTGSCWFNMISQIDSITKIAIGNHEDDSSEGYSGYISHFGLSRPYYSFNYQNTHLLVMDTDRNSYSSGSSQYNFVQSDLQSASQDPSIDWIIVYFHQLMYTSEARRTAVENLRNTYHPLFDQYGVDLVLQAHNHNYQRTFPLKYDTVSPSSPIITSNNANTYTNPEGQVFAVVGTGGNDFYPFSSKASFVSSQQDDFFGQLDIRVTENGNKLEGKYYRNGNNAILDSFSISKGNSSPMANQLTVSVNKDTATPITLTATDPNNDPLTYSIVTQPSHGTVTPGTQGGPARTYSPAAGYVGSDSFTFKAYDGTTDSNIATVSITVQEPAQEGYHYPPSFAATGSTYNDTPSSSSLQLSQFSVAAWFKTSTNFGSDAFIVNKGGVGSDSSGQNLNYGVWMSGTEQIRAGFETSTGGDQYVTSVNTYNDNQWHYAVVTNDGSTVRLYIDGVQVATKSTAGGSPESSGTKPVRVAANSRVTPPGNFFNGNIDEVRVWNDDLTAQQVANAFAGSIGTVGQILYVPFGSNSAPVANNQALNITKNTQQTITLAATDPNNDPLTYTVVQQPTHGTLTGTAPNLNYQPATNYLGPDSFAFKANDGTTDSNIATVSITVQEPNGPPVANNQALNINKNTQQTVTLTATDPNNDPLTYTVVQQPTHGTLTGTAPNLNYQPATNYLGPDSFAFKANDGTTDSNIGTVSITVQEPAQGGYNYPPSFAATGSTYNDTPSSSSLQLSQFSVAAWFKTSTDFATEAFIVNKGGIGSDSAGQNQNYQISMTSSEVIKAGFETSTGADQFVTSINKYNDGQWHYAVVTNDGSNLRLYIDGAQVATKSLSGASPESSGTKPVRVGANSRVTPPINFFTGEVDEVRVWNDDLTAQQIADTFAGTSFNTAEQVIYLEFSGSSATGYQYDPSLSLSGPQ